MKYWNQEKNPKVRAYLHGYHYGHLFLAPHLNPYPLESEFWHEWEQGWRKGAAFSVEQADIDRDMRNHRPSRKAVRLSRLNVKKYPTGIKHLRSVLDSK